MCDAERLEYFAHAHFGRQQLIQRGKLMNKPSGSSVTPPIHGRCWFVERGVPESTWTLPFDGLIDPNWEAGRQKTAKER